MNLPRRIRKALSWLPGWLQIALALSVSLSLLTILYVGVALNVPYEADQATMVVMGKAVLDGNVLLRGWTLGNQAYYTTELPFYALGVWLLGFGWKVIYYLTGLHWAMLTLAAIVLGLPEKPRDISLGHVFIAAALTLFLPALLANARYLSNAHLVGFFYCLVCLLIVRRLDRQDSWRYYVAIALLLMLAITGDTFGLYLLAIPIVLVCLYRILFHGPDPKSLRLLATTAAAVVASQMILGILRALGGAHIPGPPTAFVKLSALGGNLSLFLQGLLNLFDVDFFGKSVASSASAIGLVHLSGLLLFAVAIHQYIKRFRSLTLHSQILVAVVVLNMMENVLSDAVTPGTTRYLAPILIFGIPLACKFVFDSRVFMERRGLDIAYFLVLAVSLIPQLTFSKPVSQADALGKMLVSLHLKNGYGPYWRSNSATVATAGQVTVRPVLLDNAGAIGPCPCFSEDTWYRDYADFLVVNTDDTSGLQPTVEQAAAIFGEPAQKYSLGQFGYLLVWDHDITPLLSVGK